jgi:replicative DNA helicase
MSTDAAGIAKYQTAADVFDDWQRDVLTGSPPVLWPIGTGELQRIEIGPGLVSLFGGAPGAGKTAFIMQAVVDALRLTPKLRALVCNVEMPPRVLMDRQLARLSGIDLTTIRKRQFGDEHSERLSQALLTLEPLADRLGFVRPPFNLANVAAAADDFGADLLLLDYIQRISAPGDHADKRNSVNATMDYLRRFADTDLAVLVVAAVGRVKNRQGNSSYDADGMNLASFRESSELEFGADDAFILVPTDTDPDKVMLRHLKARHSEAKDICLAFDRRIQRFTETTAPPAKQRGQRGNRGRAIPEVNAGLARAWDAMPFGDEGGHRE